MRIGFDAHYVGIRYGGNEFFCENLINALGRIDKEVKYSVYVNDLSRAQMRIEPIPNIRLQNLYSNSIWIQRAFILPFLAWQEDVDILHVPFVIPPLSSSRLIVTIHDLAFERYPETFDHVDCLRMKTLVPWSAKRADQIITVSEHARKDIIEIYGVSERKVKIVPNAVDSRFFKPLRDKIYLDEIQTRYQLPQFFLLFLGTIQPRKNLVRLIQAFDKLSKERNVPHHLVNAGRRGWKAEEVFSAAKSATSKERIHFLGPIRYEDLPALYNLAHVFVFPSLFEGFGLPPLEAMACGTPVVTSQTSSLPEVIGSAGIFVNPYDLNSIAEGIEKVILNKELREELSSRGRNRALKFNWQNSAEKMLKIYQSI